MKKFLVLLLTTVIILSSVGYPAFASEGKTKFKDMGNDHWAYSAIQRLIEKKVLSGYTDGTFRPNAPVKRAEFAKMMVLALDLELEKPSEFSFIDISRDYWAYPYIEVAKYYLTGFRTTNGDYFKPMERAVREDMAVALVKALSYENEEIDDEILEDFVDKEEISKALRKYVAIAINKGIMQGSVNKEGKRIFNAQDTLTRAEAASLLSRVMKEEKITYGNQGEKITFEDKVDEVESDENYIPLIKGEVVDGKVVLNWQPAKSEEFEYYKVVVSQFDAKPQYPDNGYLYCLENRNQTSVVINNEEAYNGGDFGKYLKPGQKYYFTITAVFEDKKITGNVISLVYPEKENMEPVAIHPVPIVSGKIIEDSIKLMWEPIRDERLMGYKVVISKKDSTPTYPENGYLYWITDRNKTYAWIDDEEPYKNGDFGKYLEPGEEYYFSVIAVYKDKKVTGNVVRLEMPK